MSGFVGILSPVGQQFSFVITWVLSNSNFSNINVHFNKFRIYLRWHELESFHELGFQPKLFDSGYATKTQLCFVLPE